LTQESAGSNTIIVTDVRDTTAYRGTISVINGIFQASTVAIELASTFYVAATDSVTAVIASVSIKHYIATIARNDPCITEVLKQSFRVVATGNIFIIITGWVGASATVVNGSYIIIIVLIVPIIKLTAINIILFVNFIEIIVFAMEYVIVVVISASACSFVKGSKVGSFGHQSFGTYHYFVGNNLGYS
jgi:hypothetical protein